MSAEIIDLPRKADDLIWVCRCGCTTFYVHADRVECAACELDTADPIPPSGWALPPDLKFDEAEGGSASAVISVPHDLTRARAAKRVANDEALVAIAMFYDDARVITSVLTSGHFDDDKQLDWWRRRLHDLSVAFGLEKS